MAVDIGRDTPERALHGTEPPLQNYPADLGPINPNSCAAAPTRKESC